MAGAFGLEGVPGAVLLSLGSDGTDGPTDAAGGVVDGKTLERISLTRSHFAPDIS